MQQGDILGHEYVLLFPSCHFACERLIQVPPLRFMGVVEKKGKGVTNLEIGDRVVASFQIACGECKWCKKKLSSFCDRTVRHSSSCRLTVEGTSADR